MSTFNSAKLSKNLIKFEPLIFFINSDNLNLTGLQKKKNY